MFVIDCYWICISSTDIQHTSTTNNNVASRVLSSKLMMMQRGLVDGCDIQHIAIPVGILDRITRMELYSIIFSTKQVLLASIYSVCIANVLALVCQHCC